MNWKRIFTLVAIGGGTAALVTSAATTGRRRVEIRSDENVRSKAAEVSGAALAEEIARLRERLHPTMAPQTPSRNLFHFHGAPSARAIAAASAVAPPVEAERTAPVPAAPALKLIGIAEDPDQSGAGGVIRTAIISGSGDLFLAKEGETVLSRYRVTKIAGTVVDLTDTETSATLRLALK